VVELGGVGEEDVDEEAAEGERDGEAEGAEAGVDFFGGDEAVAVAVPIEDVPLEGRGVGVCVESISGSGYVLILFGHEVVRNG